MPFLILVLALLGFAAGPASAQQAGPYSAKTLLPACRNQIATSTVLPEIEGAFKEGVCVGIFAAMFAYGPGFDPSFRFCPPENSTRNQAIQLVISGVDIQPNLLPEDLRNVIVAILRYEWPCGR